MPTVALRTGITMNYERSGSGEPVLLVMGTAGSLGLWQSVTASLAERHDVIAFDNRGLGGTERGRGDMTVAGLAEDTAALLEALEVERAHVIGWSLGSAIGQELALGHPERVASLVLYGTWGRADGFQRAVITALRHPWASAEMDDAFAALGMAFSPQLLDSPDYPAMLEQLAPLFPQTEGQIRATVEQWDADLAHDALDRLGQVAAPTLVVVGEQDLLTPHWQSEAVAKLIPDARFERLDGPGSSHALHLERTEEWLELISGFLREHPLDPE